MKATIDLATDEIKELIDWYQTKDQSIFIDYDAIALRDRIAERLLEAALAQRGKEIKART